MTPPVGIIPGRYRGSKRRPLPRYLWNVLGTNVGVNSVCVDNGTGQHRNGQHLIFETAVSRPELGRWLELEVSTPLSLRRNANF